MASGDQFAAFLSYSRKDVRLAQWLVRSLEEFRLPRQTVEDLKARRAAFIAAHPIFRDEHDMPVGGVISDRLSEMLDASATMIVLCTAASAKSDWVNKEVALFASRHPGRRIIPAVAEGEPDSDESYPPALLKLGKPLSADLRDPGQRKQAVIKIAAAVLGLDVDQLVGRVEKHRAEQRRWLVMGGAVAAAVVVGLSAMAGIMANSARQADEVARLQIERLLKNAREAADKLAAKAELHAVAKPYFDRKARQRLNDRDLLLKAEWLRQQGEDAGSRKELDKALRYSKEAFAATSELLRREPDNPEFLYSHAQSAYWVGDPYLRQGRVPEAREAWEAYRRAAEHLLEVAPAYPDAATEVYYANVNLGALELEEQHNPRQAATAFAGAIGALDSGSDDLNTRLNLSRGHMQYVDALAQFAPMAEVFGAVRSWEPLLKQLETHDAERAVSFHLANSWGMISDFEQHARADRRGASGSGARPANLQEKLERDPDDVVSISLSAEVRLQGAQPDCRHLALPAEIDLTAKDQAMLLSECLSVRPAAEQVTRCSAFVEALPGQPGLLDVESSWASLLSACSHSAARLKNSGLSAKLENAASARFFSRAPEEMRLRTQLALAEFRTARPRAWITELNASLDSRGWVTKGAR